jgi:hypothetical protein
MRCTSPVSEIRAIHRIVHQVWPQQLLSAAAILLFAIPCLAGHCGSAEVHEDQRSSGLQAFDVIAGGRPTRIAILEAQLGIIRNGNVFGYSLIDRQKLPDRHVLSLWLVAWIPKLNYRFFPLIGDSTATHRVVGERLEFCDMIPSGNKRRFIKAERRAADRVRKRAIYLKTHGWWLSCCCCSNPGLWPLQGEILRLGPGYLEQFDSYEYSPIKKTLRAALGRRIFGAFSQSTPVQTAG